ncbi:hypothetical protein HK101_007661 [Irineochytrium annulatum]|nr:hypothetical protein HK101_007661 [Irineochytrium annulatum]
MHTTIDNDGLGASNQRDSYARKTVVVCGLGMVGLRFCETLRDLETERREAAFALNPNTTDIFPAFRVIAFAEEDHLAYNRVGLTQYFSHRSVDRLLMRPLDWYHDSDVDVHLADPVVAVDLANKTVTSRRGLIVAYDHLVLAMGSSAAVPTIPGAVPGQTDGCFVYRTVQDVMSIIDHAKRDDVKRAAVLGGGLLGLEAAKVCVDLGLETVVIERNPYILGRQLDSEGSAFLRKELEKLKLQCLVNVSTDEVRSSDGSVSSVITSPLTGGGDATSHDINLFIIAIGIKPRDELARSAGLTIAPRGGVVVDDLMRTSDPNVYAVGEVAAYEGATFGLVAPGYDMAAIAAKAIMAGDSKARFKGADMSTKLKLMGVNVASFGDYFAPENKSVALQFRDPLTGIYRRLLFSKDGKRLLGGILVGDTSDYAKLHALSKSHKPLPKDPSTYVLPKSASAGSADDGANDLPDEAQVCSCNNITKGDLRKAIVAKSCASVGALRACTKAGTGCGGCVPTVTDIFGAEMKALGRQVRNDVCEHFAYSRKELYEIVRVMNHRKFEDVMKTHGKGGVLGCEVCKPCVASIFASLWNDHVLDAGLAPLQDTNDRFLANIQRGGTYSVVPRIPGGEVTPEKLIVLGEVAKKYGLYTKITGGQRIDLFGAERHDLPAIWSDLVAAGFESGHAYGKALRTVKSCVGSTWCRYGRRDSVGFAVAIEQRYKGVRAPHKLKGGVSGCVRECAEAQGKDFGLIATEKGYNLYVCGNGGSTPKHAVLLIADAPEHMVIKYLDRFLMYYIATADRLQRTARWLEKLDGGIAFLRQVVVDDKLGIAEELERRMAALADSYFCEWTEVVKNPARLAQFKQFVNTDETQPGIDKIVERGQARPADWAPDAPAVAPAAERDSVVAPPEEEPPKEFNWKKEGMRWVEVGKVDQFPVNAGAAVKIGDMQVAVFSVTQDDGGRRWYATQNMCPHKRAFVLASSIVGTSSSGSAPHIACPNHKKTFSLATGQSPAAEHEYAVATFEVRVEGEVVSLRVPAVEEADRVLGTSRWRVGASLTKKGAAVPAGYEALWEDKRSRRGKYEGTIAVDGVGLVGDIGPIVGGGCDGGACGDKKLEW